MSEPESVVLEDINVLRINGGNVRGRNPAGDVVVGQTVVGEVVLLQRRAAKTDADRSCVFQIIVLGSTTFAVAQLNGRSNTPIVNALPTANVETNDGDVLRPFSVRAAGVAFRL